MHTTTVLFDAAIIATARASIASMSAAVTVVRARARTATPITISNLAVAATTPSVAFAGTYTTACAAASRLRVSAVIAAMLMMRAARSMVEAMAVLKLRGVWGDAEVGAATIPGAD